jgi:hypothetical protein
VRDATTTEWVVEMEGFELRAWQPVLFEPGLWTAASEIAKLEDMVVS